jgi:scyllo-inositol 2-dehydrogenase (NADP+)
MLGDSKGVVGMTNEPIRLGIVGLGRAGQGMHLSEISGKTDKFRVCAVCDIIPERANSIAEKYGARAYTSIEEFLKAPDIELVDIATRSIDHYVHAKVALAAGRNVFLEKPFCVSYAQAKELADSSNKPGTPRLFLRHNRRWEGKFNQFMDLADNGELGDVFYVHIRRNSFDGRNDWQTLKEFGGGQLLNWGPHIIDQALQFCSGDYISLFSDLRQINASGDCEDVVRILFKGVNGRLVDMEICCAAALQGPEYELYGSRGAAVDQGNTIRVRKLVDGYSLPKPESLKGTPVPYFSASPGIPFNEYTLEAHEEPLTQTWDGVYDDLRLNIPYRIKMEEALTVMKAMDDVRKQQD